MPMLPPSEKDVIALADWLELSALEAGDGNSSAGDLRSGLRLSADMDADNDTVESMSLDVMREIEFRQKAAGEAYPFIVQDARVLQSMDRWTEYVPYVFCLCLSYFRWKPEKGAIINPWNLFEELACIAAGQYIQGKVFAFGSRAQRGTDAFQTAVTDLSLELGEGNGFKSHPVIHPKDDKVDLVAWKEFLDQGPSKLVMFGQCAAGGDWKDKVAEMQPNVFWSRWMLESQVSPHIRSFYVPHRIPPQEWDHHARATGILFDRCRIAFWAWKDRGRFVSDNRYATWCRIAFPMLP